MFENNIYAQNVATSFVHYVSNRRVDKHLARLCSIDSVGDFGDFREFVIALKQDVIADGRPFGRNLVASESLFYGHLKALVEYAGRPYTESKRLLLPNLEHGIAWLQKIPNNVAQPYVHCVVSQGSYRRDLIRSARPWMPHYVVGPYIHYARPYYSPAKMGELRRELGKTLLVFPAHTYELSSVEYAKRRFVEDIMGGLACDFDTVLVSAYWHDADDEVFRLFEEAGARVVSAGMREDPQFISRLRTMIELSDAVAGNALGTHIGYAMCLGRPFHMIGALETGISDVGNAYEAIEQTRLNEIAAQVCHAFGPVGRGEERDSLFNTYWGGRGSIKSPEQIACILDISREVLGRSHGMSGRFGAAVRDVLNEAVRGKSVDSDMRALLLSEALGAAL